MVPKGSGHVGGGGSSQPRAGFRLGQGKGLNVPPATRFLLWAGGWHCLSMAAGGDEDGPPFSPCAAPPSPPVLSGLSLAVASASVGAAVGAAVAWERPSDANRSRAQRDGEQWGPQGGPSGQREDEDSWGATTAWRGLRDSSPMGPVRGVGLRLSPSTRPACWGRREGFSLGPLPTPAKTFLHKASVVAQIQTYGARDEPAATQE